MSKLKLFLTQMVQNKQELKTKFLTAVHTSDIPLLRYCIKNGINPNCRSNETLTALHIAAAKGDLTMGKILLEQPNIKVDPEDDMGETPLMKAIANIRIKFVMLLLRNEADPNACNHFEKTGLHIAVSSRDEHIVNVLLHYKAEPNVVDTYGNTPLSLSIIEHPNENIATILLMSGANPNWVTMKPHPLFLELCLNCHSISQIRFVKLLLKYGVDINITNKISKHTALHITSITGYYPLAEFLLENGADPDMKDVSNRTPYDMALEHDHSALIELYKEREKFLREVREIKEQNVSTTSIIKRKPKSSGKSVKFSQSSEEFVSD